ncbi:MAG: 50S ribosomal protein L25 [Anaerofustis sp.]
MVEAKLQATERIKKKGKFREDGFVPGSMYGDGIEGSVAVKFEKSELSKVLAAHGSNAKLSVSYNKGKYPGIIKELQREPVSGHVQHVDIQIMAKDHIQSFKIPVVYQGESALVGKQLMLKVHKNEAVLTGTLDVMPESLTVDVSGKELGDVIVLKDFRLNKKVKAEDAEDAVFATVIKNYIQEESETEASAEAAPVSE